MPPRKPDARRLRSLCAEVGPEDGTDPRDWLKGLHAGKPDRRKARQLCGQVAEALSLILPTLGDEILLALEVVDVEPAPDTTRLLVTLQPDPPGRDPVPILDRLDRASGRLRSEVAATITRRKAPLLVYRLRSIEQTGNPD